MKKTVALFCVLGLIPALQAQTEDALSGPPLLPPGPLIQARAPDFAEWVITQTHGVLDASSNGAPNAAAGTQVGQGVAAPQSTQDTVTKTQNLIRVVRLDVGKRPWSIWCYGGKNYMIWPDGKSCAAINASFGIGMPNPFFMDFSTSDFPGFGWVSLQYYKGTKSYHGIKSIVFQITSDVPNDVGPPTRIKRVAYIDFTTRLPIALQNGDDEYLYTWHQPPQAMLVFPSVVQAIVDAGNKNKNQMAQKSVRPW